MRLFAGQMMGAVPEKVAAGELETLTDAHGGRRGTIATADAPAGKWYDRLLVCKRKQKDSMFVRMAKRAAKARRELTERNPSETVDKIDSIAKVVFPVTYVVFNIIYWVIYLYWLPNEVEKFVDLNIIETAMA